MKRSVYLTILTIVTVICIIVGSTVHIVGFGLDLVSNLFQAWDWDWDTDNDAASGGSVSTGDGSGTPGATSSNGCTLAIQQSAMPSSRIWNLLPGFPSTPPSWI